MPGFNLGVPGSHNINALWGWGNNANYGVGDGTTTNVLTPKSLATFTDFEWVCGGFQCGAGIRNGKLYTWGSNANGKTAQGTTSGSTTIPTQVGSATDWRQVSVTAFGLAIKGGKLYSWGISANGVLGNGTTSPDVSTPAEISADTDWELVSAGASHAAAIKGGKLYSWGNNANYRTGLGTDSGSTTTPTQVGSATNWIAVAANFESTVAIDSDGRAWSVGRNNLGQTAQGTTSGDTTSLTQIGSDSDWSDVANSTGGAYLAIKDNKLYSWGRNSNGQLGDGTTTLRTSPTLIDSSSGWVLPKTSGNGSPTGFSLAIRNFCLFTWGVSNNGNLGNGTTSPDVLVPTQIGTDTDWKMASGRAPSFAIKG